MLSRMLDVNSKPELIFAPCVAMGLWTCGQVLRLIAARVAALTNGVVPLKYYKLYNDGGEPEDLAKLSQHVENLFEAPPLFYAAVTALYLTKGVSRTALGVAWLYVVARVLHTLVHTGSNNIRHRFYAYGSSILATVALWAMAGRAVLRLAAA